MKLHAGDLYWDETKRDINFLKMDSDIETDILIIGGGMSGAIISYILGKTNKDIVVVDKSMPGYGSSWGNTGIIQYNSDMSIDEMAKRYGEKYAVDFYNLSLNAMKDLDKIVNELGEDVGYKSTSSLYLAKKAEDLPKMRANYEMLRKNDFPAVWISKDKLKADYMLEAEGAIMTSSDAELNPFKMVQSLHKKNLENGIKIYKECEIIKIDENQGFICYTKNGYKIKSNKLIIATGYAKDMYPPIEKLAKRDTTYSFVSRPIDSHLWGNEEMVWDSAQTYLYFRKTEEHRLIAGGRDESGEDLKSIEEIKKNGEILLKSVMEYYPNLDTSIEYVWQSVFGVSKDGLPFIGRDENNPNKYFALGFGGNGTCYSVAAASIIKDFIEGKNHPYSYTTKLPREYK